MFKDFPFDFWLLVSVAQWGIMWAGINFSLMQRKRLYPNENHPWTETGGFWAAGIMTMFFGCIELLLGWVDKHLTHFFGSMFGLALIVAGLLLVAAFCYMFLGLRAGSKLLAQQK